MKKQEFKKNEKRLRNIWDNFKCSNIHIIRLPEGEEKEQEIENFFEKIMKEKFPDLAKKINMQVQEAQSPKQVGSKEKQTKTHHN